jgi:NhaA family Na+:H+ antiporter
MKLRTIFKSESITGIILMVCVILSLLIANSPFSQHFESFLTMNMGAGPLQLSILNWINDGLMAIFFFSVVLEIKQEMIDGHLSSFKKASVPVFAAIGGALVPAAIYFLFNIGTITVKGWGIPMATDIAFALGVLSLLGKLVPPALKVFLSTLAVVDDLLAILVIAIFYADNLHWAYLLAGLAVFLFLLLLNKLGVKHIAFYLIPGFVMWYLIHHSGVHATIAGVLTAITIPYQSKNGSPLKQLAHQLASPVNFIIMPLFVIANTNIHFTPAMLSGVGNVLGLGIIVGLVAGKPIGILLASWLSVKAKIGRLPNGISWKLIVGLGMLAGVGFTMSIFMSFLSFGNTHYDAEAKFCILSASIGAGVIGYFLLKGTLKAQK